MNHVRILLFASIIFCILRPTWTKDADETCYNKFKTAKPELEKRYGERLVRGFCAKSRDWVEQADAANPDDDSGNATVATDKPNLSPEEAFLQLMDEEAPPGTTDSTAPPMGPAPPKGTRKEIRSMTDDERNRFFTTLNTLKATKIGNMTKYDIMTDHHNPLNSPEAHFGAAFLPFHRQFLYTFEKFMHTVDSTVSLPYWDPTLDVYLPDPKDSILWSEEFMGNGDGDVVTGPFKNWTILKNENQRIKRDLGEVGRLFFNDDVVNEIMNIAEFKKLTYCVDESLEMAHTALHGFIGGHMVNLVEAVNDPCFFSVHAWIDFLWEEWRKKHQNPQERETQYGGYEGEGSSFHWHCTKWASNKLTHPDRRMRPFNHHLIIDGLSNRYTKNFYTYEPRPTCPSCQGSPYLYCDAKNNRCLSKIRVGGNCKDYEGKDICHKSLCRNGICTPTTDSTNLKYPDAPGCYNLDRCCDYWAGKGECKNYEWMSSVGCKLACKTCKNGEARPNIRNGSCSDYYPQLCPKYKARGLCAKNSTWMEENCKLSCQVCSRPASYFAYFCELPEHDESDGCKNYDKNCNSWAKKGDCERNSWWMKAQCPLACKACT